jgi:hypothetical protein
MTSATNDDGDEDEDKEEEEEEEEAGARPIITVMVVCFSCSIVLTDEPLLLLSWLVKLPV